MEEYEKIEGSEHYVSVELSKKNQKNKTYRLCQEYFNSKSEGMREIVSIERENVREILVDGLISAEIQESQQILGSNIFFISEKSDSQITEYHLLRNNIVLYLDSNDKYFRQFLQSEAAGTKESQENSEEEQESEDENINQELKIYLNQAEKAKQVTKQIQKQKPNATLQRSKSKSLNYLMERALKRNEEMDKKFPNL